MKTAALFPVVLLAAIGPMPGIAQQTPPSPPVLSVRPPAAPSQRLSLDVVVADKSGQAISGLQPGDFKLLDNKQPQDIAVRNAIGTPPNADPPVEAVVVMDAINANFTTLSTERQWVERFLKSNGGELPLPTALAVLTDRETDEPTAPSRDGHALLSQLDNGPSGLRELRRSEGYWGAVDRNQLSLQSLVRFSDELSKTPGRKLLVWISPGWAGFSRQSWLMSDKEQQGLYSAIAQISTALRQANVTLYSIDPLGAAHPEFYYETFLKGIDSPRHTDYGDLMLQVIAVQSGGLVLFGNNNLSQLIERCIADAKSYYILTFEPPHAARPNEYHAIQVQVDKPGLKARTRTGYYAQP